MVYIFLADGFEEIETLGTVDILRRCGIKVQMLSATGRRVVEGAHGIVVKADSLFRRNHTRDARALIVPGGSEGARALNTNVLIRQTLAQHASMGTIVAAICAGPTVLANSGVLRMKHVTCYPSLRKELGDVFFHDDCQVVSCDNIITASGPAATQTFAFTLAEALVGRAEVTKVKEEMLFTPSSATLGKVLYFEGNREINMDKQGTPFSEIKAAEERPMTSGRNFYHSTDSDELIF